MRVPGESERGEGPGMDGGDGREMSVIGSLRGEAVNSWGNRGESAGVGAKLGNESWWRPWMS